MNLLFGKMHFFSSYLAAKKRNPLSALQEDEPVASPAPSSIQMPFTPGRTPNKNRGTLISFSIDHLNICI